ncbi:pyridoxal phosphate-dependent aminotransferase [Heliophilum fasciatum]|uniref:Aminotransferase n=1 Tax=Heliophilum fasciatum TaxID=35700 RepID=A0A4R2RIA2_9FIRM|nr:threonine-phosphate decarboxylase [Heliophilum fasciatum]MCW2278545.1 threonine-phosphate decarboxylase [Heliophilum fasciatum]TCP63500.1 L-threonine O-3-phosphate decarboxylase [Heliophilum fasciatum]
MITHAYRHGGDVWSVKAQGDARQWIDFSANINFLGLSPQVKAAMVNAIDDVIHYPDPHCRHLRAALSTHLQVPTAAIAAGNGAVDLLDQWLRTVQPRRVLITDPGFGQYLRAIKSVGAEAVVMRLTEQNQFAFDGEAWQRAMQLGQCDSAILCSPHNPVGWTWTKEQRDQVLARAEKAGIHLLVDESFLDFLPDGRGRSCVATAAQSAQVAVLYSLTKFFALPGIRLGALIAHPARIAALEAQRDPWSVNHLAQVAGVAALQDQAYQEQTWNQLPALREQLIHTLRAIPGCRPYSSTVNFVLADIRATSLPAPVWTGRLRDRGLLVRDCSTFDGLGSGYLRFAVRPAPAIEQLGAAMKEVLAQR